MKLNRRSSRFAWLVLVPLQLALLGIVARVDARADAVRAKAAAGLEAQGQSQGPRVQAREALPRVYVGAASFIPATFEFGLLSCSREQPAGHPSNETADRSETRPRSRAPPTLS